MTLNLASCCLPCPQRPLVFKTPCEKLMYEAEMQGVTVIQRGDTLRMILPADLFFTPATANLIPDSRFALDTLVQLAQCYCYNEMPIRITGYTDNIGTIQQQQALGLARANVIADYFETQLIPYQRLNVRTFGARGTVSSNGTPAGEADNRRVEITLP